MLVAVWGQMQAQGPARLGSGTSACAPGAAWVVTLAAGLGRQAEEEAVEALPKKQKAKKDKSATASVAAEGAAAAMGQVLCMSMCMLARTCREMQCVCICFRTLMSPVFKAHIFLFPTCACVCGRAR